MTAAGSADEPLVLLSGMNCSARLWVGVEKALGRDLPELAVEHRALDRPTVDACVESLVASLPRRFALAGLSLGAIVAMAVARQVPDRVSRLCLMSANPYAPTPEQVAGWAAVRRDLAAGRTARDVQRDLLPVLLHPERRTPELEAEVLAMADETGEEVLDRQLAAQATRIDERRALRQVAVPTLILAAAQDALCPVWKHEEMHRLVDGSTLVVLDGVGHLSALETPEPVAARVAEWLTGRSTAAGTSSSSPG